MSHQDIVRMLSLGHKRPGVDDVDQIGCFGVGFKVMKLPSWTFRFEST
jgi:hypothetical protein